MNKNSINTRLLTVDPGDHTGVAFWDALDILHPEVDSFQLPKNIKMLSNEEQFCFMINMFRCVLIAYKPDYVIIEGTQVYLSSSVSLMSAGRGDLIKLTTLIGGYCAMCHSLEIRFKVLTASKWKGQMSKSATFAQVNHITGGMFDMIRNEHTIDAVGIGLSHFGYLPIGRLK